MMDRHWAIFPKYILKRWLIVIVNNSKGSFMQMIYTIVSFSSTKHASKVLRRLTDMNYQIHVKALNFLPTFLHWFKTYSSKCKLLSIIIPDSFSFLPSQILVCAMLAHIISCSCPDSRKWHLPWFNFT